MKPRRQGFYSWNTHKWIAAQKPALTQEQANRVLSLGVDSLVVYVSGRTKGNYYRDPATHGPSWNKLAWQAVEAQDLLDAHYDFSVENPTDDPLPNTPIAQAIRASQQIMASKPAKLSTEFLVEHVAARAVIGIDDIVPQFYTVFNADTGENFGPGTPDMKDELLRVAGEAKNWKRISKSKLSHPEDEGFPQGTIERVFDCRPLDDQLRAYVYTDPADVQILEVRIQGE